MNSEKQIIEEIAKDLCQNTMCDLDEWNDCSLFDDVYCLRCLNLAKRLYDAGYRKQIVGEWNTECIASTSGGFDWYSHGCSNCGHYYKTVVPIGYDYCPNCGMLKKGATNERN